MFSCEFCEISTNTFFTEHLWTTASARRLFLRKQGNSTKERHIIPGKYVNLYQNAGSNFARLLGVCPPDYNSEHVNIPRLKFPGKNTPQNTFLQNNFQWLLSNFSHFLKKGKKQKQFFKPPLCLIRLKSCSCIKIVKIAFIHNFEKKCSNLSSVFFKFCNIKYRSSHQRCSIKKVFLEISENSQENTCARVSFLGTFFTEQLWPTAF